jgi:hypothetical protein
MSHGWGVKRLTPPYGLATSSDEDVAVEQSFFVEPDAHRCEFTLPVDQRTAQRPQARRAMLALATRASLSADCSAPTLSNRRTGGYTTGQFSKSWLFKMEYPLARQSPSERSVFGV